MIDQNSRYSALEDLTYEEPDGHNIVYKPRRFLPHASSLPVLEDVTVSPGDRLDLITARSLGDPLQFWQICDANNCMNPFDLTGEDAIAIGRRLHVPAPQFEVER